jgi:hypothetical protein
MASNKAFHGQPSRCARGARERRREIAAMTDTREGLGPPNISRQARRYFLLPT